MYSTLSFVLPDNMSSSKPNKCLRQKSAETHLTVTMHDDSWENSSAEYNVKRFSYHCVPHNDSAIDDRNVGAATNTSSEPSTTQGQTTATPDNQVYLDMAHRNKPAVWEKYPVKRPPPEKSKVTTGHCKTFQETGGNFRLSYIFKGKGDIDVTIPQKALEFHQNPFNITCNLYASLSQCVEKMDKYSGLGTFMLKNKPQLLRQFKALHSEQRNEVKSESESGSDETEDETEEEWDLITPVIEIHGDDKAPKVFKNYTEMKIAHTIRDKSKLCQAEIYCYREDQNGRKTVEKVPNLANVLVDNPEAYFTIDATHITIFTKHYSWYVCRLGHRTILSMDVWIFPLYHYQHDKKRQKLELKIFLADTGETTETMKRKLAHKLDKGTLLDDDIKCQSVKLPEDMLNVKAKAKFVLGIQNTDDWEPFRINDEPVRYLKQKTRLGDLVECSFCGTRRACPADAATFILGRKVVDDGSNRIARFEGSLLLTMKPFTSQGKRFSDWFKNCLFFWRKEVDPDEDIDDEQIETILEGQGITRVALDVALPGEFEVRRSRLHRDSAMGDSLQGSEEGSINDIQICPDNACVEYNNEIERPAGKIDHRFLKWCTQITITNDNNLYSYFLELDQTFFDGDKIDQAKQNANNNIQMAAFNLARDWNNVCKESDEHKLDKMCDALKAINKQALEIEFRKYFLNER